jgi:hypothetical protein
MHTWSMMDELLATGDGVSEAFSRLFSTGVGAPAVAQCNFFFSGSRERGTLAGHWVEPVLDLLVI